MRKKTTTTKAVEEKYSNDQPAIKANIWSSYTQRMFSRTYYLFFKQTEVNSWNDMSCVALLSEIEQNILVILKSVCFLFPFFLYEIPMKLFGYQFPLLNWSLLLNHSLLNLLNSQRSLCLRSARTRPFEAISLQRIMQHRSSFFSFFLKVSGTNYKPCPVICDSAVKAGLVLAAGSPKREISAPASGRAF